MKYFVWIFGLFSALSITAGAAAQSTLRLPAGADWTHPHSGIIVPATLGGIDRSRATAFADQNLDVGLQFDTDDGEEALSIYVYRNTNGSAAVWFSQAQKTIELRDIYAGPSLVVGPEPVTLSGRDTPGGLQAVYNAGDASIYRSTGVALFAVGEWYLKIRATSASKSAEELAQWMGDALAAITVSSELAGPRAIAPVVACPSALVFKGKAKNAKRDEGADMVGGLIGMMIQQGELEPADPDAPDPIWCRDPGDYGPLAVYRPNASDDAYLIALSDAGRGIVVGEDVASQLLDAGKGSTKKRFSITLHMPDQNVLYVAQDRLPTPARAYELLENGEVTSSISTWSDDSTINIITD